MYANLLPRGKLPLMGAQREIRLKLSRAEKHICDLDAAIRLFCESKPYRIGVKPHPVTEVDLVRLFVESVNPVPVEIGLIIGDAVHNLRSALDHLTFQLVLANGKTPRSTTEFPIRDPSKQYTSAFESRKVEDVPTKAKDIFRSIQPAKTGDMTLWNLQTLDIADKHRLIITAQLGAESWSVGPIQFDTLSFLLVEGESITNMPRTTYERQPHEHYQLSLDIAFGEAEIAANELVVPYLRKTVEIVSNTISLFDGFF